MLSETLKVEFFILLLAWVITPVSLSAAPSWHDGAYYCVVQFSGGVAYDDTLKKWDSARFRPGKTFIARFQFLGPHHMEGIAETFTDDYRVSVTRGGENKERACLTYYPTKSDRIEFTHDNVGRGDCETSIDRYIFSLKNNRFLVMFESGDYVIGSAKDSDTPSISGGTCTKIP